MNWPDGPSRRLVAQVAEADDEEDVEQKESPPDSIQDVEDGANSWNIGKFKSRRENATRHFDKHDF